MIKIWGRISSINVQKILLCVETLHIAYERVDAGLEFGVVNTPQYKALNPNSLVPTIEDEGFTLWESNAIVRYLCTKAGPKLGLREEADRGRWMDWQLSTLGPPIGVLFLGLVRAPGSRSSDELAAARTKADAAMTILNDLVGRRSWISGDAIGAADFAIAPFVHRWLHISGERPSVGHVETYYRRLMESAAARKVLTLPLK